jgi:hypothetical protein
MTMRNRVTPLGDIEAFPMRGAWTGNRGVLHSGTEIVRYHASDLWITCVLEFRGRWRQQWLPNRYTHLFFHDEAVAFAAGHRPCAECRRAAYLDYRDRWAHGLGVDPPSAQEMNRRLHRERLHRGTHRRRFHERQWQSLPDGAFVLHRDEPYLVSGEDLIQWTRAGYRDRSARPCGGDAVVITPPSTLAVLADGYPVQIDRPRTAL